MVARPASSPHSLVILRLRRDVVEGDAGQAVALGLGGGLPGPLGEADPALDAPPAVGLDVTDDEDDDGVVGEDRPEAGEHVAQEQEVRLAVVGVVERRVDLAGIEAEEPRPQPVVVAVLDDAQVRRRGHDQARPFGPSTRAQGGPGPRRHIAGVAQEGDALDRRRRLAEQAIELLRQPVEDVALRRREVGPGREIAHVARRHRERVRHQLREVARALAVEDAGQRGGEEPIGPVVEPERRPDVQQLAERPRVEREGDLDRHRLDAVGGGAAGARDRDQGGGTAVGRDHPLREGQPAGRLGVPAQPELRPGG